MVTKPTIGQSGWGAILNNALDALDDAISDEATARAAADAAAATAASGTYPARFVVDKALGDGVQDATAAIQAAIDAASLVKGVVHLPSPAAFYRITAPLVINDSGITVKGDSNRYTSIRQATAATDCIQLAGDPANDAVAGTLSNVVLEDLDLRPVAGGVSTGKGINAAPAVIAAIQYNGNFLTMRRVRVRYFDVCLDSWRFDNCYFEQCSFRDGRIGARFTGNANDIHADGLMVGGSETGLVLGDGSGGVIRLNDLTTCPQGVRVLDLGRWTILGGDFEHNNAGTEFVSIEAGGHLTCIGTRFLKGSGSDVPAFRVANGAFLSWIGPQYDDFTVDAIYKSSPNAVVNVVGQKRTTQSIMVSEAGLTRYPAGVEQQNLLDNATLTPDVNNRGRLSWIMARDSSSTAEDRPVVPIRKADGTFEVVDLIDSRTTFSTNGSTNTRRAGVKHYRGKVAFTTAAATYTDVTITIGAYTNSNFWGGRANVSWSTGAAPADPGPTSVSQIARVPASGTVTFRIHHPSSVAGGLSAELVYEIDAAN